MRTRKQQLDFFWQPCRQIQWQDLPQAQHKEVRSLLCRFFISCLDLAGSNGNTLTRDETEHNTAEPIEKESHHASED